MKRRHDMQNFHERRPGSAGLSLSYKSSFTLSSLNGINNFVFTKARARPRIALVTSGIGTKHGGIGVVAQLIVSALNDFSDLVVWEHHAFWPRFARIPAAVGTALFGSIKTLDLVVYDHVDLALLHAVIPRLKSVPYAVFLHGIEVWKPLVGRRREALLGANLLLVNSATTETEARGFNPWLPKVEVTWLGVERQNEIADVGSNPPVGLIVGRMADSERLKGHDAVMDAWPLIRSMVPDAKLMIVGEGNDKKRLQKRAKTERLEGIEFFGRISDAERNRMYRSSRLLFYPSKQEGFGLAGVEAASFGLPVLGLAGTVTGELFPSGTGAVMAKDLSRKSIAESGVPVLRDAQHAAELGRAASARVNAVFLEEHFIDRFRRALAPLLLSYRALVTNIDLGKSTSSTTQASSSSSRHSWPR